MLRLTATEASRHFNAVLGRVAAGEEIEVVRNGAPVAVIAPPPPSSVPPGQFRSTLEDLEGADSFADDLRALEAELGGPPDTWGS